MVAATASIAADLPRERLWERGLHSMGDEELLALVLGVGTRERNARAIADEIVRSSGGMVAASRASPRELSTVHGVGVANAARIAAAFELGRRMVEAESRRDALTGADDVWRLLGPRLAGVQQEVFIAIGIDTRNHILEIVEVGRGTVCSVHVHPREVFRPMIRIAAAGIVLAHNHPSGDTRPSHEDIELTHRLCAAGDLLGLPIVDHVIITARGYRSMCEWEDYPLPSTLAERRFRTTER